MWRVAADQARILLNMWQSPGCKSPHLLCANPVGQGRKCRAGVTLHTHAMTHVLHEIIVPVLNTQSRLVNAVAFSPHFADPNPTSLSSRQTPAGLSCERAQVALSLYGWTQTITRRPLLIVLPSSFLPGTDVHTCCTKEGSLCIQTSHLLQVPSDRLIRLVIHSLPFAA